MVSPSGSNAVQNSVGAPSPLNPVNANGGSMSVGMGMFASGSQSVSSWTATPTVTEGMSASPGMETNASQSECNMYSLTFFGLLRLFHVVSGSDNLRRAALGPSSRRARTHAVIVCGPPG